MNNDIIAFHEVVAIFRRYFFSSLLIVVLSTGMAIGLAYSVPKRYKSKALLSIQAAYFQIPLVGDLVAGANDAQEYKAQREALLRYALNNDFLDKLGEKYQAFKYPLTDPLHTAEREALFKRIDYFSPGANSYQIGVTARTPQAAYEMTQATLDQMISTLVAERQNKLIRTRQAIHANLVSLKEDMQAEATGTGTFSDPNETLEVAQAKLARLEQRFTPSHPSVIQQQARVAQLKAQQANPNDRANQPKMGGGSLSGSRRTLQDLYDDLLKKYNYLNIVIDMEKVSENSSYLSVIERPSLSTAAIFPKKIYFAVGGLILGFLLAAMQIIFRELKRGTFANPEHASHILEAPFLGSLPPWSMGTRTRALPPPQAKSQES